MNALLRSFISKKWLRDKKNYLFSDHVQYLLTIEKRVETESDIRIRLVRIRQQCLQYLPKSKSQTEPTQSASIKHLPKSKKQFDGIERELLLELK